MISMQSRIAPIWKGKRWGDAKRTPSPFWPRPGSSEISHWVRIRLSNTDPRTSEKTSSWYVVIGVSFFNAPVQPWKGEMDVFLKTMQRDEGPLNDVFRLEPYSPIFFVERLDGTTADERFFAQKPKSIVEWVFEQMPHYAASRKTLLSPLAAAEGHLVH
jgi:hypothetical protein